MELSVLKTKVNAYFEVCSFAKLPLCITDEQGQIQVAGSCLLELLGRVEPLEGKSIFQIDPSLSILTWRKRWKKIQVEEHVSASTMLMKANEEIFDIDYWAKLITIESKQYCIIIYKPKGDNLLPIESVEQNTLQKMMQHTLNNTQEMIFWINQAGDLSYFNQALEKKLGYTKEELQQMKAWDFSPRVTNLEEWQEFMEIAKSQNVLEVETKQYRKDGKINHVATTSTYIEFKGEAYIFSIVQDITKKKAREALFRKMKHSFDFAREMIAWYDEYGEIIYANKAIANELDYTTDELQGHYLWDIAPSVTKENWENQYWNRFKSEVVPPYETILKSKKGKIIPIEVSATHLQFEENEYLLAVAYNITERKVKEAQLARLLEQKEKLRQQLEDERNYLRQEITVEHSFNEIITQNKQYRNVLQKIQQVADTNATVLILGETGTGKELIARAVHTLSNRDEEPLVKVNCAAIPPNLIESELFGHEKGAFTGAFQRKIGRFEVAHKGTIFLDEIGEMPIELQAKLLRVLQEGELERLGSTQTITVDIRVIAATNRDLEQLIEEGKFREDLYYRLNVFPIENMPLRERKDDIPILVSYFIKKYCSKLGRPVVKVNQANLKELCAYDFPGNIRELENLIERALILSKGGVLNLQGVLPELKKKQVKAINNDFLTFEAIQRQHILEALRRTGWKVTGDGSASELLQINGKTLASKMRKMNIKREDYLSI